MEIDINSEYPVKINELQPGWFKGTDGCVYFYHGADLWEKFIPQSSEASQDNAPDKSVRTYRIARIEYLN